MGRIQKKKSSAVKKKQKQETADQSTAGDFFSLYPSHYAPVAVVKKTFR
jgi:hypothetical protein